MQTGSDTGSGGGRVTSTRGATVNDRRAAGAAFGGGPRSAIPNFGNIGFGVTPKAPARPSIPSSGKSVGSNSYGQISHVAPPPPAPPAPPAPPSIGAWLAGDTTYKSQMDASHKALVDYLAQMTSQQNQYQNEYTKNLANLGDQEKLANTDLTNDYASRGLSTSGLFLKALSDLATDYNKRESDLAAGRSDFLANLASGKTNFLANQNINETKYKQDAINRRAAQYGG